MFNVGSCFSGIGGLELGLEATGRFKTLWQIEKDAYATSVLQKHWPDVQRFTDIRDVSNPPAVDVICGGFPCQDVSMAGKRAGLAGSRTTLWGEMFRLVREVKPRWLLAENVPGLLSSDGGRFFGGILRDLAHAGYDAEWGVLSAASVGAPHLRQRLFLVSKRTDAAPLLGPSIERSEQNGNHERLENVADTVRDGGREGRAKPSLWRRATNFVRGGSFMADSARAEVRSGQAQNGTGEPNPSVGFGNSGEHVADTIDHGSYRTQGNEAEPCCDWPHDGLSLGERQWAVEPNVGRVAHGVPSRVDRLRCLGNAVVPQVSRRIAEMILEAA